MTVTHDNLHAVLHRLPTDYTDYGGNIDRWAAPDKEYPDCSMGCRFAAWLKGVLGNDWCVCTNPDAPRKGLLTFEHMAGFGCFQEKRRART